VSTDSAAQLADEAHRLVGVAPRRALRTAEEAVRAAHRRHDGNAESQGYRALGRAYRVLGRLDDAVRALGRAVRRAEAVGAEVTAAEARMSLAYVLMERGQTGRALVEADRASRELTGVAAGRMLSQRALLHQKCGQLPEALSCYRAALGILRKAGERLPEARIHNNRGLLYLYSGRLNEAEPELRHAREMYCELGQELLAADAVWNLGLLSARRGDIPAALARIDEAEQTYHKHGVPAGDLLPLRGELLLSVGLRAEARETAERAVRELSEAGMSMLLAEALLLLAQAALAEEDTPAATQSAARAVRLFTRQQRPGWTALARYVELRAEEQTGELTASLRRRALRVARDLAAIGWRAQELDARLIAARVALHRGDRPTARRELAAAGRARSTGPLELRIRAWYAEALRRQADGDRRGVERALRAGMRVLEQHRSMLGATELRVQMASHVGELVTFGMSLAVEAGSADRSLEWVERSRARALWRPIHPPADPELAEALAELRRVSSELEAALLGGTGGAPGTPPVSPRASASRLQGQKTVLEDRVRLLARKEAGSLYTPQGEPPPVAALAERLGNRVLVEVAKLADDLVGITVRDGVARLHRLSALRPVQRNLESLLFALRRLAVGHGTDASLGSAREQARAAARRLDAALLAPLAAVLGDRPVVISPPATLQNMPWSVLPSLRQRPLLAVPSAAIWLRAEEDTAGGSSGRVLLAAGPGLPGAAREITDLAHLYERRIALTGRHATVDATLAGLDGANVAHIAAHGRVRGDNPLFSALDLADGQLTVYDLERLRTPPRLVLLSACQSGVGQALAGDEVMGLTATLFALGTRTVVATVIPIPDQAARPLMLALHDGLRRGLPPATALTRARDEVDQDDPSQLATAAAFCCYGAG
jgi:tetratricopeptide (TPR) repeat protein